MINDLRPEYELFVCDCESIEHQVVFQTFDFGKDMSLEKLKAFGPASEQVNLCVYVTLPHWMGFWQRLWHGIKYIFKYECKYGHFDVVNITEDGADRMIKVLQKYKEKLSEYKKTMGE